MRVCKIIWILGGVVSLIASVASIVRGDMVMFAHNMHGAIIATLALIILSLMRRISLLEEIVYGKR